VFDSSDCCGHDDGHFHQNFAQNPIGARDFWVSDLVTTRQCNFVQRKEARQEKKRNKHPRYLLLIFFYSFFLAYSFTSTTGIGKVLPLERIIPHPNFS
jgi:hypothetical protein